MRVLLAESDTRVAEDFSRIATRHATVSKLDPCDYGELAVPAADLVAVALGSLPDGEDAIRVASRVRRKTSRLPLMLIRREVDAATVNMAQALRCELVCVPFHARNVLGFVEDAVERFLRDDAVASRRDELLGAYGFSQREREMIEVCAHRGAPREVCAEMGISYSTYRTMRARMLRKSGVDSFETLCALFRRQIGFGGFDGVVRFPS